MSLIFIREKSKIKSQKSKKSKVIPPFKRPFLLLNFELLLFHQLSILKKEFIGQFISKARKEFIHKNGSFAGEGEHKGPFLFAYGAQNMFSAFFGAHHLRLVHGRIAM